MVCGAFSYDHMQQLEIVNRIMNSQKYRDEILGSDVEHARMPEHGAPG